MPDTPDEADDERSKEELEESGQHSECDVTCKIFRSRFKPVTAELTQDTDPRSKTLRGRKLISLRFF